MTAHTVTAGATSSGIVLRNGDELDVLSGGVAIDTVVSSGGGGAAYVYNGGQVNGTSGGGGGGGTEYVYNGGTASGSAIDMGGAEMVLSGGVASAIAIRTGGSQLVNTGGTASFAVVSMGSTLIGLMVAPTAPAPCFAAGTRIATDRGRFAVETLRPGDLVLLQDGRIAPIVWIGHRRVDCARHPHPEQAWPFRVAAGAFGPGLPRRDLYLSPDHAVLVTGALVPIKYLAAGVDIVQVPWADRCHGRRRRISTSNWTRTMCCWRRVCPSNPTSIPATGRGSTMAARSRPCTPIFPRAPWMCWGARNWSFPARRWRPRAGTWRGRLGYDGGPAPPGGTHVGHVIGDRCAERPPARRSGVRATETT